MPNEHAEGGRNGAAIGASSSAVLQFFGQRCGARCPPLLSNHVPGFCAPSFQYYSRGTRGPGIKFQRRCPWDTKASHTVSKGLFQDGGILLSCPDVSPEGLLNRGYNRPRLKSSWRTMKSSLVPRSRPNLLSLRHFSSYDRNVFPPTQWKQASRKDDDLIDFTNLFTSHNTCWANYVS